MKASLYIQAILEIIGGLAIYFAPYLIVEGDLNASILMLCKLYGIAALTIGLISIEVARTFEHLQFYKHLFLLFMLFQLLIAFTCYGFYQSGTISVGAVAVHFLMFGVLCLAYFKDIAQFEEAA